jgi:hypothetical protein
MKERIWANEPARREIAAMLRRKGLLGGGRQAFGALDDPVPRQDPDRVNYRKVEFAASDLDDLAMALGNFTLNVAVAGLVEPAGPPGRHRVTITAVGVYVRDSYDFEGDQPLGFWDDSDNSVSTWNPLAGTYVSNASFRDWRSTTGMGGDFRVFSDVKVTRLDKPDVFVA